MVKYLAIVLLGFSSLVNAQTEQTTPNLITSGTNHTWTGVTTGSLPTGCATAGPCPGGPTPLYDPSTNTISYSYNSQATVAQTIAINNALANAGAGVKIGGYNYSYQIRNMNGDDRQGGVDTLVVKQAIVGTNGSTLLSSSQTYNTKFEWTSVTGAQTASTPIDMIDASYLRFSATGGDNGYWGGYFGPQIRNVNMSLRYTVDPCATNPAYSPTCVNYNTVNYSGNLVPNPLGYAASGSSIDQSYAINQALQLSGAGVMIHGFQWGYVANANGPYCGSWDFGFLGCLDWRNPSVSTSVSITDNNGSSIYSQNRTYSNSYNTTSYQYLFPASRNLSTLGRFNFTATTNDAAYVGSMWSKAVYTPDPCTVNPLSSTSCAGYQQAYLEQQCASNPLYSTQCAGYAAAYLTQQCNANPLYSPSCPGYAAAYLTYQCSINPLYSTTCVGYEEAYLNQQCGISPLYSQSCSGYRTAYHDQQCSINPLFATDCLGYDQAYLNQQCSINPLYSTTCSGYAAAYKQQQCSINPLFATDCTGYAAAYKTQQCNLNGLYDKTCPNYAEAYAKKMLLEQQGMAGTVATAGTVAAMAPAPTTTTTTDSSGEVKVAVVKDENVNAVITSSATSASPAQAATATVPLVVAPPPPEAPAPKKAEAGPPPPQMAQGGPAGDKPQAPTARQQLAERRAEAAKKDAVEKGKNLANEMGKATDMESQKQVQNVVIQAMGFTPGFDAYGKTTVPDGVGYKPFTVYNNQKTIDNRANLRMFGGAEVKHQEMVDSQFQLGK
jgi:hypothetical protein